MAPDISIIGTGALGSTLARALDRQGYDLKSLFNRTETKANELGEQLGVKITGSFPASEQELGRLLFLAVPDDAIGEVVRQLSEKIRDFSGRTVAHCSGNSTSQLLDSLKETGAETAAFHPIQTFTGDSKPEVFDGICISLEGTESAVRDLRELAGTLGADSLPVTQQAKPYLHAGAVMASNYLVTLLDAAGRIAEMGGVEAGVARRALMPLVLTALENASRSEPPDALSGPVARGDVNTVKKHLELLEHNSGLLSLYKQLGLRTVELARTKASPDKQEALNTLKKMFLD